MHDKFAANKIVQGPDFTLGCVDLNLQRFQRVTGNFKGGAGQNLAGCVLGCILVWGVFWRETLYNYFFSF